MLQLLKPQLVVFISVDLVQSTSRKFECFLSKDPTKHDLDNKWFNELIDFYYRFNDLFSREITKFKFENKNHTSEYFNIVYPKMWKVLGDELLYYSNVKNEFEIYNLIHCLLVAVNVFQDTSKTRFNVNGYILKVTVWTAVLPILNEKVYFNASSDNRQSLVSSDTTYSLFDQYLLMKKAKMNQSSVFVDFVGPSIDAGFRLAEISDSKKIVISLELAWFLAEAIKELVKVQSHQHSVSPLEINYFGKHHLKEAYGNLEYPIFYIEKRLPSNSVFLDNIKQFEKHKQLKPEQISKYAISYFHEFFPEIFKPFIPESKKLSVAPKAYTEKLAVINASFDGEIERATRMKEMQKKISPKTKNIIDRAELIDYWKEVLKNTGRVEE